MNMAMEVRRLICEELKLPWHYVSAYDEDRALVLVHESWVRSLVQNRALPNEFPRHPTLSNEEIGLLLQQLQGFVEKPWRKLEIHRIGKRDALMARKLPRVQIVDSRSSDLTYYQLLHYVSETNYTNRWKETMKMSAAGKNKRANVTDKFDHYNSVVREAIQRLSKGPLINVQPKTGVGHSSATDHRSESTTATGSQSHPNSLAAISVFESSSSFYLVYPYMRYSVSDCVMFSPAIFASSTIKPLFIIYQLLQATRHFQDNGLCLGDISVTDIRLDSNLWIYIEPKILHGIFIEEAPLTKNTNLTEKSNTESLTKSSGVSEDSKSYNLPCEKYYDLPLLDVVLMWTRGEMSNFDYLMTLNYLAGRRMGNPNYHPVLPWIMDFTVANGGWRDLTKSKYRLNKGDQQLELTYETLPVNTSGLSVISGEPAHVPHHVSDVLSEITYYVYKARQTPRSLLCHYVRSNWVPAEYPSNMQRMYEWTPDECIPEFFYDADIFRSIHRDLSDLEIPWWASSAEDFVAKHREALESQHVTERLHHWIDLTFGYKLSGSAAVKAKNVCYHLVDQHTNLIVGGVVQLFTYPHPHHSSLSLYLNRRPTCLQYWKHTRRMTVENSPEHAGGLHGAAPKEITDEDFDVAKYIEKKRASLRPKMASSENKNPDRQTIILPKDYAPLARLNQLDSLYTFALKATSKIPENQQQPNCETTNPFHQRHIRDMIVVGCLIVELFLANKLKTLRPKATLEERYKHICSVLLTDMFELPRCVRHCVKLLLQLKKIDKLNNLELPKRMPVITDDGLPPPSAHQLLQPLINIIPFPVFFQKMYQFLCRLKSDMNFLESETSPISCPATDPDVVKRIEHVVKKMQNELQQLLPQLNDDGLGLITPYIKDVFTSPHTTVLAAWYLFGIVSQCIGPRQTFQMLIQPLVRIFDVDYPTSKHMKLFHRSYLLQLIVRLGLQTFLSFFSTILIEAVGGCKDFAAKNTLNRPEFKRQNSHLRSTEFEGLRWEQDSKDAVDIALSPFEPNLNQQEVSSPFDKSEFEDGGAATAAEDQIGAEPEVFVFDNEEFIGGSTERIEADILDIGEENRFGENSSDSTSGDGLSADEVKGAMSNAEVKRPRSSCSFSEGFPIVGGRPKRLLESESYSSSVPNLASVTLSNAPPTFSVNVEDAVEAAEPAVKPLKQDFEFNISDVATESVIWLSHRLGPVLTAKYLSRNLLRMLSLCYLGSEQLEYIANDSEMPSYHSETTIAISPREVVGDRSTCKVLRCLVNIASLYGEHFVLLQYFPHMTEIVTQSKKRVTSSCEAGLIGNLVLIHHIVPCLSDAALMDHLQDIFIKAIMYPTVRLIASSRQQFPNGGHARQVIAYKFLDALCIIGLRIGFEMTRKHLTRIIKQFFAIFSKVYSQSDVVISRIRSSKERPTSRQITRITSSESMSPPINESDNSEQESIIRDELSQAFSPELAYVAYILFCKLAGGIHADQSLPNDELIHRLCLKHDHALSSWSGSAEKKTVKDEHRQPSVLEREAERDDRSEVTVVGNRIDIKVDDEEDLSSSLQSPGYTTADGLKRYFRFSKCDITKLVNKQMDNDSRHLKGNWLAYWEHELGRNEKDQRFNFNQIKLQTFVGHTSAVRTLCVLDNENSFMSASKDKTVKLWSLRSRGDGSALSNCQWTYNNHKKSVFSVTFLDSLRLAVSCDSTVHVWDPFMGACLKAFDSTKHSPATLLAAMPAPSTVIITSTAEASIRFMDVRTLKYMHEFKVSLGQAGLIRGLAVSPNGHWIAVGYSSGIISILDVRTGLLSSTWKGHDGEIAQVKAYNDHSFVSTALDQCVSVWNADDGKLKCHLRGHTETVHCLGFYKNEMISGTTANRIGVHTSVDSQASFSSTRLSADTFKGMMTAMSVLSQNRVLLLGNENGHIRLLC